MEKIIINKQYHLSPIIKSDITRLVEYCNDIEIYNNTLLIPNPYLIKDAIDFLNWIETKQIEFGFQVVHVIRNETEELMGIIGLICKYHPTSHKEEIGYWMGKPFRGKGITTATVKTFTDYLFANSNYVRIEAQTYMHNNASQKVLEKAGFEFEGILKKNFSRKVYMLITSYLQRLKMHRRLLFIHKSNQTHKTILIRKFANIRYSLKIIDS